MKKFIKNFIAVMAFMVAGHYAVIGQEDLSFKIEVTSGGFIATATDTSDFAVVLEPDGGSY